MCSRRSGGPGSTTRYRAAATSGGGGQQSAPQLDYAPLPPAVQQKVAAALKTVTFAGQPVMATAR